jgi:hypothetical protein
VANHLPEHLRWMPGDPCVVRGTVEGTSGGGVCVRSSSGNRFWLSADEIELPPGRMQAGDPDLSHLHESPAAAAADPETRVVGLVIDAVKSGRRVRIDVEIDKAES